MRHFFLGLLSIFSLTSCMERLTVHTEYLSYKNLASFHVGTPDPELFCPTVGQRLVIHWTLPNSFCSYNQLTLKIKIRFSNNEETEVNVRLNHLQGTYIYSLLNDDFFEKCGILTYKVDLLGDDLVLETWNHQLWAERITF